MSINSFRGLLYQSAKQLGHIQAAQKAAKTGSVTPIVKRIARVYAGKQTGSFLGRLFR